MFLFRLYEPRELEVLFSATFGACPDFFLSKVTGVPSWRQLGPGNASPRRRGRDTPFTRGMQTAKSSPHLTITAGVAEGSRVARVSLTQDTAFTRCVPSPPAPSPARAVAPTSGWGIRSVLLQPPHLSLSLSTRALRCRAGRSGMPRRISPPPTALARQRRRGRWIRGLRGGACRLRCRRC